MKLYREEKKTIEIEVGDIFVLDNELLNPDLYTIIIEENDLIHLRKRETKYILVNLTKSKIQATSLDIKMLTSSLIPIRIVKHNNILINDISK